MQKLIGQKLEEIEQTEKVKILHCVESGSRAWGFASPDSDYDVRFIYVRQKEYYLRLEKTRDVIEWQLDNTLDINGWDLQKALRLLHSSNPTLFEWNNSPIVYRSTPEWRRLAPVIESYFMKKSGLYHYLSMATGNYREYLKSDTVKLKKYFYVLRPILACKWILQNGTPPPMLFETLVKKCLEDSLKPQVESLLKLKMQTPEMGTGNRIDEINNYIEDNLAQIENRIADLPKDSPPSWDTLNEIFLSLI